MLSMFAFNYYTHMNVLAESLVLCDGVPQWWGPHVSHSAASQVQAAQSKVIALQYAHTYVA